jgi:hypothetical protein
MAGVLEKFLGGVFASNSLQSYAHASRLYLDDFYKYAPKNGWIFYVQFKINTNTKSPLVNSFIDKNSRVIGMLVKSADLPKFRIGTEVLNQYNRRSYIQNKIEYTPINMTFHDDHNNTTTGLWEAYYRYYFADDAENTYLDPSPPEKYGNIKYTAEDKKSTSYGLNNNIKDFQPFFRNIELFQINRHQYTGFNLLNPIITEWSHDSLNQSESKFLENKMTVGYEAVQYANGRVGDNHSPEFNLTNYDKTPSPLSIVGKGNNSILGPGGIVAGITELMGGDGGSPEFAYPLGGSKDSPVPGKNLNPFQKIKGAVNLVKNLKNVTGASLGAEALNIAGGALGNLASGKGLGSSLGSLVGGSSNLAGVIAGSAGALGAVFNTGGNGNSTVNKLTSSVAGLFGGAVSAVGGAVSAVGISAGLASGNLSPAQVRDQVLAQRAAAKAKVDSLKQQQTDAELVKAQHDAELAAAEASGDPAKVDAVMTEMEAKGYTDPQELANSIGAAEAAAADADAAYMVQKQLDDNAQEEDNAEADDPSDNPLVSSTSRPLTDEEIQKTLDEMDAQDTNNDQFVEAGSGSDDTTDFA